MTPRPERPSMPGYIPDDITPGASFPWEHVRAALESSRNYWLCTTRPDGRPHSAPVWAVWLDDVLYFSTGRRSRKYRNIAERPAVVVTVERADEAIVIEGRASDVEPADAILTAYEAKYDWRFDPSFWDASAMLAVRPGVVLSFKENLGDSVARWRF